MGKKGQRRFGWRRVLGILALSLGAAGAMETSAVAAPQAAEDIYLAQVGVRSRINSPTPLNLRPRTHIPLPQSRYSRYRNYHHNYGYKDSDNRGSYRQRRSYRRDRDYDRRGDQYGQYRRDRYEHRHRRRRPGGSITIYF